MHSEATTISPEKRIPSTPAQARECLSLSCSLCLSCSLTLHRPVPFPCQCPASSSGMDSTLFQSCCYVEVRFCSGVSLSAAEEVLALWGECLGASDVLALSLLFLSGEACLRNSPLKVPMYTRIIWFFFRTQKPPFFRCEKAVQLLSVSVGKN